MSHITYGFHTTPFGECLIATTDKGICHLSFVDHGQEQALELLQQEWPKQPLVHDAKAISPLATQVFAHKPTQDDVHVNVHLKGTPFQLQVWEALLEIPRGTTTTYEGLAVALERPTATRAVANALAANRIAFIIPCHRVISKTGTTHKYRWGSERKKALLKWEKR
jgi:AraC family transcriptional regulator of adaptative response/methylated-DNA-[protein]-cysteine methyltransferase